jgi:hypothetical protein
VIIRNEKERVSQNYQREKWKKAHTSTPLRKGAFWVK